MNAYAQPPGTHLAQINVGVVVDDLDSSRLAGFVDNLDRVNGVAERSEGFVWRLKDETGAATEIRVDDNPRFVVNVSLWESAELFERFVWRTVHKQFYNRRSEWFERAAEPHFALWWAPIGHRPTAEESMARLRRLQAHGPSPEAFGWAELPNVTLWAAQRCA